MIDPGAIQRRDGNGNGDAAPDVVPKYDVAYIRLNAGLSQEQTGDGDGASDSIEPYLVKAIQAFTTDTSLKLYRHPYECRLDGRQLMLDPERSILLPGLACEMTKFECDGVAVPTAAYRVRTHEPTGCKILKPRYHWTVNASSEIVIEFDAGIESTASIPVSIQSVLATRIRFDTYSGAGDLLRYNDERRRFSIGTIVYE